MIFALLALGTAVYAVYSVRNDSQIREDTYTQPLKTMPCNTKDVLSEMLDAAVVEGQAGGKPLGDGQIVELRLELLEMLAKGSVEQRNWEMRMTREKISYLGQFLSWFMKQKGLTYDQIEAKYAKQFSSGDQRVFQEIIQSASRANPNVFEKFVGRFTGAAH